MTVVWYGKYLLQFYVVALDKQKVGGFQTIIILHSFSVKFVATALCVPSLTCQ